MPIIHLSFRIDMEYLRALVIGSYWLSDISWTLSGYAIRRASEFHLRSCYYQILEAVKDPGKFTEQQLRNAMDGIRVLYLLYICDHHLSILYGRPSIMRDNENYIFGWEQYLASPLAADSDRRIASQLSLLLLMSQVRESFGPEDNSARIPESYVSRIATFERKLDDWVSRWSSSHNPNKHIGTFPSKGVIIHYHFAKLYLESYVFRGLPESSPIIPDHFLEMASAAVAAATSIINLLLEDRDLQIGLAGVPHYFHGMIAFASVFLLKVATKHSAQLFVNIERARMLIAGLSQQLRVTKVGRDHLVHRMAEGLEKMAEMIGENNQQTDPVSQSLDPVQGTGYTTGFPNPGLAGPAANGQMLATENELMDSNAFGFGDPVLGLGMPFFDFEGTSLDLDGPMFSYTS